MRERGAGRRHRGAVPAVLLAIAGAGLAVIAGPAGPAGIAGAAEVVLAPTAGTERAYPLRGEPVAVSVRGDDGRPLAGAVIEALYSPNSQTSHTAWLDPTDAEGRTTWTPVDAGIVALVARQGAREGAVLASVDVTVRFGGFPLSGLAVMLVAGTFLFGGAGYGFVKLLGPEGSGPPAIEPPST